MFHYAFIDVGSMHIDYSQWKVPSSHELAERFNLPPVTHDAYSDNLGSILLVRLDVEHKKVLEMALKSLESTPKNGDESNDPG